MGRVGPTWVRIGSVMVLYCTEMDSRENRYVSDQPEMDSGWDRYGLALARHVRVREPSCIGAVRYGFGVDPFWFVLSRYRFARGPRWIGSVRHWPYVARYAFGMGAVGVRVPLTLGMVSNHKYESQ